MKINLTHNGIAYVNWDVDDPTSRAALADAVGGNYLNDIILDRMRTEKKAEIGRVCEQTIYDGVDVRTSLGVKHFALTMHDQAELLAQLRAVKDGAEAVPYHADGEFCRYWSAEDFVVIEQAATAHIFYHRIYCNCLNMWISRTSEDDLGTISYGDDLPDDLAAYMATMLERSNYQLVIRKITSNTKKTA